MSLAKRFFDGFLGKREKDEEKPEPTAAPPPPKTAKVAPPPPRISRVEPPAPPGAVPDRRNDSQTFHVSAPRPPVPEDQRPGPTRLPPVGTAGSGTLMARSEAGDPMRRSQTIRVGVPAPGSPNGQAAPLPLLRDDLRRSQTIRVSPPPRQDTQTTPAPAQADRPALKRLPLRAPGQGVNLPLRALLASLPPALRGPAWRDELPEGGLVLNREELRQQLDAGHVSISVEEARRFVPEGWLAPAALGDLDLDLAEVMAAVPADLIPVQRPPEEPAAAVTVETPATNEVEEAPVAAPEDRRDQAAAEALPATAEEAVGTDGAAQLPCAALLAVLPPALRGPAWRAEGMPEGTFPMARGTLVEQLGNGRVAVDVKAVADALPDGWLAPSAQGEVELDLPTVVSALPHDWLQPSAEEDQDVVAIEAMANLFAPAAAPGATPETAPQVPPAAAASPTASPAAPEDPSTVALPAALVLAALPEALRGAAWRPDWPGAADVRVPRDRVTDQLATGRVELQTELVRDQLPAGTCRNDVQGTIRLDLAAVVAVIPPELLHVSAELDQEAVAVAEMRDLFAPASAPATPTAAAAAAPVPPPPEPEPVAPATINLPCAAALSMLPPGMRGPAWRPDGFPEVAIALPKDEILEQLSLGSVKLPLAALEGRIPPGWVAPDATGAVELDLADVVAAVPPEMMGVTGDLAEDVVASSRLGTLFSAASPQVAEVAKATEPVPPPVEAAPAEAAAVLPALPVEAAPAEAAAVLPALPVEAVPAEAAAVLPALPVEAVPAEAAAVLPALPVEAAPAEAAQAISAPRAEAANDAVEAPATPEEERHVVRPPVQPALLEAEELEGLEGDLLPEWSGVETSMERAPLGVNLNTARAAELMQLPGIGVTRAQSIVDHRATHGHFRTVYELAELPGIGPSLFRRITGLSVRRRVDRHMVMGQYLSLPSSEGPLLGRIVEAIRAEFNASGALLTNLEGIPLAVAGEMKDANKYAALGSRFFFRTRKHLQRFVDKASDCIILPGSTPPLLLLSSENVVVILALAGSAVPQKRLQRVRRAMREIGWLLSRRAVVLSV